MKRSRCTYVACAAALLALAPADLRGQRSIDLFVGAGHTATDVEAWGSRLVDDWNQFTFDGHVQALLFGFGPARLGLEAGHSTFMWYRYNSCPGCVSPVYGETTVAATRILAVAQLGSRFFTELAAGVHMFDGYSQLGAYGGLGVRIPLMGQLSVPVKARAGFITSSDDDLIPLTLSAGLSYRLP